MHQYSPHVLRVLLGAQKAIPIRTTGKNSGEGAINQRPTAIPLPGQQNPKLCLSTEKWPQKTPTPTHSLAHIFPSDVPSLSGMLALEVRHSPLSPGALIGALMYTHAQLPKPNTLVPAMHAFLSRKSLSKRYLTRNSDPTPLRTPSANGAMPTPLASDGSSVQLVGPHLSHTIPHVF